MVPRCSPAGIISVRGDVAGTSARLQPAEIHVHWERGSLADLLRLFRGRDYGVRGTFALDATANSGTSELASPTQGQPGDWSYSVQARAAQIHRWDLNERPDNPRVNVNLLGRLNVASGEVRATRMVVETPKSNLRGTARAIISRVPVWEIRLDSAGVQAADGLAWFRAFQPGVQDAVSIQQYFTGAFTLRGWPLDLHEVAFSSAGGEARLPELTSPVRIGPIEGGRNRGVLTIDPVRISCSATATPSRPEAPLSASAAGATKRRAAAATVEARGIASVGLLHDFERHAGALTLEGHADRVEDVLKIAAAFGRPLNHGWELTGPASAAIRWEWNTSPPRPRWNGRVEMPRGELQAAGLNLPLQLSKTRIDWKEGARTADVGEIKAFGALWSGALSQPAFTDANSPAKWNF